MSYSNNRNKDYETAHHLVSRIAHRVYFLKEDERKDFLEMVRRAAVFVGVNFSVGASWRIIFIFSYSFRRQRFWAKKRSYDGMGS